MEKDDVELIRNILSGDDSAFSDLVQKYQKSVHALAWRQIGDFQVAEEITQDTFLQAYKKLATLKNPNQFAGWLYVIARNLCTDWHRRKKPTMQSLEATKTKTLEKTAYERFVAEEREKAAAEHRRELVKNLLEKLPESERTVVTLHYLGEMTSEAISKFMGVSVNTIRSRLRRARKRLQKEESMIRETLGSIQLPANLTENIMEQITHITPTPASSGRPLVPWAALGSAAVIFILLLGASNQLLNHFQKPYSLEAQSETAIEIVDTSIILNIQPEPDTRRRIGNAVLANKNNGAGQQVSDDVLAANNQEDSSKISATTHQWTQARGPQGGNVHEIFLTSEESLYAVLPTGIYKMTEDESGWVLINNTVPTETYFEMPMAEHEGTLYIVSTDQTFASNDGGVTWDSVGPRPTGSVIEFLTTDEAFYLVMDDEIFRSTDAGKHWALFNDELKDREVTAAAVIGNTVFVGTNRGIYRLKTDTWEQLSVGKFRTIKSLAVSENTLYVGMKPGDSELTTSELKTKLVRELMRKENSNSWEIFRSEDLGDSWIKITPRNKTFIEIFPSRVKILAAGKTVLAMGSNIYRSRDRGETWIELRRTLGSDAILDSLAVAVNEDTFYKESFYRLERSIDAGKSWHPFMKGIVGSKLDNFVAFKNRLYVHTYREIVQSTDGGDTWSNVRVGSEKETLFSQPMLTVSENSLYGVFDGLESNTRLYRLSDSGDAFVPIHGIPAIESNLLSSELGQKNGDVETTNTSDSLIEKAETSIDNALKILDMLDMFGVLRIGGLAVSGETFYVEFNEHLVKWNPKDLKWVDTGLDTGELASYKRIGLAVSGQTVYVGKNDGHLFQSFDGGKNWKDITSDLPLVFEDFEEIVFADATVYVATDKGVLTSQTGRQWQVIIDSAGANVVMDSLAVDGTKLYGACDTGIYQLDDLGEWELISQAIPDQVLKLVIHNKRFYIATQNRGLFHIPIEKQNR